MQMKIPSDKAIPKSRVRAARLFALITFGVVAIFCVGWFVVPAIYPDSLKARTRFSSGTALPGAPARHGLHFGAAATPFGEQTRYVYVRISSRVWVLEFIRPEQ